MGAPTPSDRWQTQGAVTIVATIAAERVARVRTLLEEMGADPAGNATVPLGALDGVHFARLFVTEAAVGPDGTPAPAHVVYMSDVDGSADAHVAQLADVAGDGLDRVFGDCAGYPRDRPAAHAERIDFLRRGCVKGGANYVNTIGRTVAQIRGEAALRRAIEDHLDLHRDALSSMDALGIRAAIRDVVTADEGLRWALTPAPSPPLAYRAKETALLVAPVLGGVILLPVLLPVALGWLVALRIHEARDPAPHPVLTEEHLDELRAIEDHVAMNQFTVVGFVKPGWFRGMTTRLVVGLVDFGARHLFNNGNLAGVKTIHFARWMPLGGWSRLVFCSNYDGSTESYMDDFIDKLAWGLNASFSNGAGYPPTRWLLFGGARDEETFKAVLRSAQIPTQVWFSAYDTVTALNVVTNARVRAGLSGDATEAQARAWLQLL
ncbi:MAG TPA: hypothetical protein VFO60_08870 [Candidatus Dormibacteraeota bacterium]|nr:hypothetical protein [Candidatus Dormibacteraeota bacterium]